MLNYTWYFKDDVDSNFVNLKEFELDITNDQYMHKNSELIFTLLVWSIAIIKETF